MFDITSDDIGLLLGRPDYIVNVLLGAHRGEWIFKVPAPSLPWPALQDADFAIVQSATNSPVINVPLCAPRPHGWPEREIGPFTAGREPSATQP
jgi:hypothetical protein